MYDKFGDRMKMYEKSSPPTVFNDTVSPDLPVFVRLDGKAFHTWWTKKLNMQNSFDDDLSRYFQMATINTCQEVGQVIMAYSQSDEVTFLLSGWQNPESQIYFGGKIQKIVSVFASMFSVFFDRATGFMYPPPPIFDARVWNVPKDELENVFIWRQMDARRNSVSGLAQSLFSHRELQGKSTQEMMLMCLHEKGEDWNELSPIQKWGFVVHKEKYEISDYDWGLSSDNITTRSRWVVDNDIPYFVEDRNYITYKTVLKEE